MICTDSHTFSMCVFSSLRRPLADFLYYDFMLLLIFVSIVEDRNLLFYPKQYIPDSMNITFGHLLKELNHAVSLSFSFSVSRCLCGGKTAKIGHRK